MKAQEDDDRLPRSRPRDTIGEGDLAAGKTDHARILPERRTVNMSWWVGKDREAFNAALKDHTQRVMQRESHASTGGVAVLDQSAPPVESTAIETQAPRTKTPAARFNAARREGLQRWCPGKRGRIPKGAVTLLHIAKEYEAAILTSDEVSNDAALGRAAIVMLVGFLFRQRLDWIVGWTHFSQPECRQVAARLRRYGIWRRDGTIACLWMDVFAGLGPKATKDQRRQADVAFWLDALVAKGECTREKVDGDFRYGLKKWEREA